MLLHAGRQAQAGAAARTRPSWPSWGSCCSSSALASSAKRCVRPHVATCWFNNPLMTADSGFVMHGCIQAASIAAVAARCRGSWHGRG